MCLTCVFNELMYDWRYVCVCMCMSVLCLRDWCTFCVTFPALAFSLFIATTVLSVPCGGRKTSPRTCNRCCYHSSCRSVHIVYNPFLLQPIFCCVQPVSFATDFLCYVSCISLFLPIYCHNSIMCAVWRPKNVAPYM